VCEPYEF
jgi:hypothetical protein